MFWSEEEGVWDEGAFFDVVDAREAVGVNDFAVFLAKFIEAFEEAAVEEWDGFEGVEDLFVRAFEEGFFVIVAEDGFDIVGGVSFAAFFMVGAIVCEGTFCDWFIECGEEEVLEDGVVVGAVGGGGWVEGGEVVFFEGIWVEDPIWDE